MVTYIGISYRFLWHLNVDKNHGTFTYLYIDLILSILDIIFLILFVNHPKGLIPIIRLATMALKSLQISSTQLDFDYDSNNVG